MMTTDLKPGMLIEAVPTGISADGSPITRPIRRRLDRAPWPSNPGGIVISDGTGVDAVNADSIRIITLPCATAGDPVCPMTGTTNCSGADATQCPAC